MKRHYVLFAILLFFVFQKTSAQTTYFSNSYGLDTLFESADVIKELPNGDFIIFGESAEKVNPDNRKWNLLKVNSKGSLVIDKSIRKSKEYTSFYDLTVNDDGSYLFSGVQNGNFITVLTDSLGNVLVEKNFKIPIKIDTFSVNRVLTFKVKKKEENGYFIYGRSNYFSFMVNFDKDGNTIWEKDLFPGDTLWRSVQDIIHHNNRFIIVATASRDTTFKHRGLILQALDSSGNLLIENYYPGKLQTVTKILPTTDGNYLAGGNNFEDVRNNIKNSDIYITKFSSQLDVIWNKAYFDESDTSISNIFNDRLGDMAATPDGGAIIYSFNGNTDIKKRRFLIKIDNNGNKNWVSNLYDMDSIPTTTFYNIYSDLIRTSDGGFGLVGYNVVNGRSNYYFLKTNSIGTLSGFENIVIDNKSPLIFPNPSTGDVNLQFSESFSGIKEISLFDITGREIRRYNNVTESKFLLQRNDLQKGIYILKMLDNSGNIQQAKIIFE